MAGMYQRNFPMPPPQHGMRPPMGCLGNNFSGAVQSKAASMGGPPCGFGGMGGIAAMGGVGLRGPPGPGMGPGMPGPPQVTPMGLPPGPGGAPLGPPGAPGLVNPQVVELLRQQQLRQQAAHLAALNPLVTGLAGFPPPGVNAGLLATLAAAKGPAGLAPAAGLAAPAALAAVVGLTAQAAPASPPAEPPPVVEAPPPVPKTGKALVLERMGANAIVSTPYGEGVIKSLKRYEDTSLAIIELTKGGSLTVPAEKAAEYEVVGKVQPLRPPKPPKVLREPSPPAPEVTPTPAPASEAPAAEAKATEEAKPERSRSRSGPSKKSKLDRRDDEDKPKPPNPDGEWKHGDEVLTVLKGEEDGEYTLHWQRQDALQVLVLLPKKDSPQFWSAQTSATVTEGAWEVELQGPYGPTDKLSLIVKQGEETINASKISKPSAIPGKWQSGEKSGKIKQEKNGPLTLVVDEGDPLNLVHIKTHQWLAIKPGTTEKVHVVEHDEGDGKLTLRPCAEGAEAIEFKRAKSSKDESSRKDGKDGDRDRRRSRSRTRSRKRSRSRSRRSRSRRKVDDVDILEELDEFVRKNSLSKKTEETLKELSAKDQRHIMGLDGSRNQFVLAGQVRDPDAVVMSRIRNLRNPVKKDKGRGRSRSRSRDRRRDQSHRRDRSRRGRHRRERRDRDRGRRKDRRKDKKRRKDRDRRRDRRGRGRRGGSDDYSYDEESEYYDYYSEDDAKEKEESSKKKKDKDDEPKSKKAKKASESPPPKSKAKEAKVPKEPKDSKESKKSPEPESKSTAKSGGSKSKAKEDSDVEVVDPDDL